MVTTVAMTIFAAVAFSASSYGFGKIDKKESDEKRHNEQTEKFNRATEKYNEDKEAFDDWKFGRSKEMNDAENTFDDIDNALKFYNQTHPDKPKFNNYKPKFSDYYKSSPDQKNGELIYVSIVMLGAGYLASKLI